MRFDGGRPQALKASTIRCVIRHTSNPACTSVTESFVFCICISYFVFVFRILYFAYCISYLVFCNELVVVVAVSEAAGGNYDAAAAVIKRALIIL